MLNILLKIQIFAYLHKSIQILQNLELTHEARAARALRDELDIQRERANKVHLLETELQSYKDKMSQMESLKCRIEEVREENKILVETKEMLEDQLESSRKRCGQIMSIENELYKDMPELDSSFILVGSIRIGFCYCVPGVWYNF